jgi:hypothetical protein
VIGTAPSGCATFAMNLDSLDTEPRRQVCVGARPHRGRAWAPLTAKHISAARTSDDQARLIASKVRGQHQITVIRSGLLGQVGTMLAWFIARGGASPSHRKSMITS